MIFTERFFEFLRNELLNANESLLNQTGQPRQNLKAEPVRVCDGRAIHKDNSLVFGSDQGTRQIKKPPRRW